MSQYFFYKHSNSNFDESHKQYEKFDYFIIENIKKIFKLNLSNKF